MLVHIMSVPTRRVTTSGSLDQQFESLGFHQQWAPIVPSSDNRNSSVPLLKIYLYLKTYVP